MATLSMRVQSAPQGDGQPNGNSGRAASIANLNDADIDRFIGKIREGDAAAFTAAYELFHPPLLKFAVQFVSSRAAAEDAVQNVFLNIWLKRSEWTVKSGFRPYLYRSVRNYLLNEIRHRRVVERSQLLSDPSDPIGMGTGAINEKPDQRIDNTAIVVTIAAAIQALPERQRSAVILRWYNDLTTEAVGEVLGITRQAASKLLQKAVIRLRIQLEQLDIK